MPLNSPFTSDEAQLELPLVRWISAGIVSQVLVYFLDPSPDGSTSLIMPDRQTRMSKNIPVRPDLMKALVTQKDKESFGGVTQKIYQGPNLELESPPRRVWFNYELLNELPNGCF